MTQEANEMSAPMLGSQEPVGWVVRDITGIHPRLHASREDAEAFANCQPVGEAVPLFAAPALTDEEREAVGYGMNSLDVACSRMQPKIYAQEIRHLEKASDALRGLLKRLS